MTSDREFAELARELDVSLREIRRLVGRPLDAEFAKGELTGPQRAVMHALVQSGELTLSELRKRVGLAHSTVSGIVDRLENRGMVERRIDAEDRRYSRIGITEPVRAFLRETMPMLRVDPLIAALRRASPEERSTVAAGIRTLHSLLNELP